MSVNEFKLPPAERLFEVVRFRGRPGSLARSLARSSSRHFRQRGGEADECKTFVFGNEDHTLGNVLRHIIMQMPETEFCGYSVPHPSEPYMHLRVQMRRGAGVTALQALKGALAELGAAAAEIDGRFREALARYDGEQHAASAVAAAAVEDVASSPAPARSRGRA